MKLTGALLAASVSTALGAQASTPAPAMAKLAFMVGDWRGAQVAVADAGSADQGRSTITVEVGGNVLVRRDHTDTFTAAGQATGSFDQLMMIFAEDGAVRADYTDGKRVTHYVAGALVPGRSVDFTTEARPGVPTFRLQYLRVDPMTLRVTFQKASPGGMDFQTVAIGNLKKVG